MSEHLRNHRIHPRFFYRGDYGRRGVSANRDQSASEVWSFERKSILILVNILANKACLAGIVFRKMMLPGTFSLISVPELEELRNMSLPPMRAARSRIPRSPKCASFLLSSAGSLPEAL